MSHPTRTQSDVAPAQHSRRAQRLPQSRKRPYIMLFLFTSIMVFPVAQRASCKARLQLPIPRSSSPADDGGGGTRSVGRSVGSVRFGAVCRVPCTGHLLFCATRQNNQLELCMNHARSAFRIPHMLSFWTSPRPKLLTDCPFASTPCAEAADHRTRRSMSSTVPISVDPNIHHPSDGRASPDPTAINFSNILKEQRHCAKMVIVQSSNMVADHPRACLRVCCV